MNARSSARRRSHFFYRKEVLKTTWKFRLLLVLVLVALVVLPHRFWARQIGHSLLCKQNSDTSDALLLENFNLNYGVFMRGSALQKAGVAPRVLIPSLFDVNRLGITESSMQLTRLAAQAAKLETFELIPIREREPVAQNAAKQIRDFLVKQNIRSVVVVTPGFRSRRSEIVYDAELAAHGIRVGCVPVFTGVDAENWTSTWHGMQQVLEQFMKLQYYRFYVLR